MNRWQLSAATRSRLLLFAGVLAAVLLVRATAVDWHWVPTGSMKPTILEGDLVLVNRLAWDLRLPLVDAVAMRWGAPRRGDVVVFNSPEDGRRLVKRVIGMPGDRLRMRGEQLWINGRILSYHPLPVDRFPGLDPRDVRAHTLAVERLPGRPHAVMFGARNRRPPVQGELDVPEEAYFVLGDHRDNSRDSRYFRFVSRAAVLGRAERVLVSLDLAAHWQPRWRRFGQAIQ